MNEAVFASMKVHKSTITLLLYKSGALVLIIEQDIEEFP